MGGGEGRADVGSEAGNKAVVMVVKVVMVTAVRIVVVMMMRSKGYSIDSIFVNIE